jgi:hypothetical protein
MLDELDRRLARRASSGSCGCSPLALAKRLRMSVKEMTPLSRPDILAPGIADAEIAGAAVPERWVGAVESVEFGGVFPVERGMIGLGGTRTAGVAAGVGGPEEAGDGLSTTHIRCE